MVSHRSASTDGWSSFIRNLFELQLVCDVAVLRRRWSKNAETITNIVKPISASHSATATDANVKPPASSIPSGPEVLGVFGWQ